MDKVLLKIKVDSGENEEQGKTLEALAVQKENEQQALLDAASIEQAYQEALAIYVQEIQERVDMLEDRLESVVDRQRATLQRIQSSSPGRLALPNKKQMWVNQEQGCLQRLHQLEARLEHVREIRDGMGLHTSKIDELATRKMRIKNPELADRWSSMRETIRRQKFEQRSEKKRTMKNSRTRLVRKTAVT